MARIRSWSAVVLSVAAMSGCRATPVREAAVAPTPVPVSCWDVSFSRWSPDSAATPGDLYPLPTWLRLFDTYCCMAGYRRAERSPALLPVIVRRTIGPPDSLPAWWTPEGADSITIVLPSWWSTGLGIRAVQRGDSLVGRARVYVDVTGGPDPEAQFRGHRTSCARGA